MMTQIIPRACTATFLLVLGLCTVHSPVQTAAASIFVSDSGYTMTAPLLLQIDPSSEGDLSLSPLLDVSAILLSLLRRVAAVERSAEQLQQQILATNVSLSARADAFDAQIGVLEQRTVDLQRDNAALLRDNGTLYSRVDEAERQLHMNGDLLQEHSADIDWLNKRAATIGENITWLQSNSWKHTEQIAHLQVMEINQTEVLNEQVAALDVYEKDTLDALHSVNRSLSVQIAALPLPTLQRVTFLNSSTWVVPAKVTSVVVSLVGGGGSGYGWRVSNSYGTGPSGGFLQSYTLPVTPGEQLLINVGLGGKGAPLLHDNRVTVDGSYLQIKPVNDDGLSGWPGMASSVVRASSGETLLRCAGGSGAFAGNILTPANGALVVEGIVGYNSGASPSNPSATLRVADGPYTAAGAPGACGPDNYGLGISGTRTFSMVPGKYLGGATPLGYGGGGAVQIFSCATSVSGGSGTCILTEAGRNGVVHIDLLTTETNH